MKAAAVTFTIAITKSLENVWGKTAAAAAAEADQTGSPERIIIIIIIITIISDDKWQIPVQYS